MQGTTYRGKLVMDVCVRIAGSNDEPICFPKSFGYLPIMLQSRLCHLRQKTRSQLIRLKEEPDEFGGTFICNGIERIIRMLIQQRRHYIMAIDRAAYRKRGANYTPFATLIRCCVVLLGMYVLFCERITVSLQPKPSQASTYP
jgi:DNA-directed RNA polymerase I subunit RPA2